MKVNTVINATTILLQRAETVADVYDIILYALCFATPARGAFLSTDGKTDYFDAVVGSYRSDRIGKKGGIKIWEYDIPVPGKLKQNARSIWLYKSHMQWLIGLNSDAKPSKALIERVLVTGAVVVNHIKRREQKIDGRDPLTGLYDRGTLFRDLRHLMEISRKTNTNLWILFIDLNNFKVVNDILGHDMGDRVLRSQAFEIKKNVKGFGNAYRYGGDEFVCVIPGLEEHRVIEIARRIELTSEQAPGGYTVSASVGIGKYDGFETAEELIKKSDAEMYERKKEFKNLMPNTVKTAIIQ